MPNWDIIEAGREAAKKRAATPKTQDQMRTFLDGFANIFFNNDPAEIAAKREELDSKIEGTSFNTLKNLPKAEIVEIQNRLSERGLYVGEDHKYFNDGIAGGITKHGLRLAQDDTYALKYLEDKIGNKNNNPSEIIKMQTALNKIRADNGEPLIAVDGKKSDVYEAALQDFQKSYEVDATPKSFLNEIQPTIKSVFTSLGLQKRETPSASYESAFESTIKLEGGYANVKQDRGGETMCGISCKNFPGEFKEIMSAFKRGGEEAAKEYAKGFYKEHFWDKIGGDDLPENMRSIAFDAAVNHGSGRAKQWLEQANGDPDKFLDIRERFYARIIEKDPSQQIFEKGWANRMDEQRAIVAKFDDAPATKQYASADVADKVLPKGEAISFQKPATQTGATIDSIEGLKSAFANSTKDTPLGEGLEKLADFARDTLGLRSKTDTGMSLNA